jgi:glycosyltransferase involved in cell wall biosynthesis
MNKQLIIFNPSIEDGGVEKNLFLIANHIANKKIKVIIISADKNKRNRFNKSVKFVYPKNINFENSGRYKKYFYSLILLIKTIIFKKNVTVFSFQANIYTLLICKILGIKTIVRLNTAPQGWDHNFIKSKIYKFFIKKADGIIVNSLNFKNEVKLRYKVNSKLILNPFDFEHIKLLANKKIKKIFPDNVLRLINVGRLTDQKDQILLLKTVNLIKYKLKVYLIIIGKGQNYALLKKYINKNKLHNQIKLLGYKKNPFQYIKQSDIFLLSSKYEGSPNVLVEALFLKKHIMSTNCPTGPKEILKNGKLGKLFNVGDYKMLAKLLLSFKKERNKTINYDKQLSIYNKEVNCKKYYDYIKKFI